MQNCETLIGGSLGSIAETIQVTALGDNELLRLSNEKLLSFSLNELHAVQNYYRSIGREPTDIELETIAQTWSEHCKHKTFKGVIEYKSEAQDEICPSRIYDDLLKETVVKATQELNKPFCLSVFKDNAGIIDLDREWGIAFKVETHNHPSALEPYGGAGTGTGGVIRDILGAGLGAKPILNTDVFCVAHFSSGIEEKKKVSGILPPERILHGVVAGVRDYGNRMGIPTTNGAVVFHDGYCANPLVFCGTVGIIPKDKIHKEVQAGDLIVSMGGRTGRDGIHGATFSSVALEEGISASVVQIGNAIVEKKTTDIILQARDKNLYRAVTDCGAGGFSSAVGELASECGAKVFLEKAVLKYEGLLPWEIWLSESQERMVLAVPPEKMKELQDMCDMEDVECSVMGEFTDDQRLRVFYKGEKLCDLDLNFMHDGLPRIHKKAFWKPKEKKEIDGEIKVAGKIVATRPQSQKSGDVLKKLLAYPNIASKKWIVRQYDHEVQGGSIIKPFVGAGYDGPSDASVSRPHLDSWRGFVISNGINPLYGEKDPYWMAANVIDEALRNLVAVGGDIGHCAILDNFCWGNINDPEILGGLVRASQGCYDFAKRFGVPFISGKDSLNNTWREPDGKVVSIPGTLLISAMSVIEDVRRCVTMDFKKAGNLILILGETKNEMGGSHFNLVCGTDGGEVPKVKAELSRELMSSIHCAIEEGIVQSCHDISEGGIAVSLAEMCMGGNMGAGIDLSLMRKGKAGTGLDDARLLFSESASRWIIEIKPEKLSRIERLFSEMPFYAVGKVEKKPFLKIRSEGKEIINKSIPEMKRLWNAFSESQ